MQRRLFGWSRRPTEPPTNAPVGPPGPRTRWLRPSGVLTVAGCATLLLGSFLVLEPWYEALQSRNSPEIVRAQRNADAPQPIWITPSSSQPTPTALVAEPRVASSAATQITHPAVPAMAATSQPVADLPAPTQAAPPPATPTPVPSDLQLVSSEFVFLEPPEPGAAARLTVTLGNPTDQPGGPITLLLPLDWSAGYAIQSTDPLTSDGAPRTGARAQGGLRLTFDGPAPESEVTLTVNVVATAEVIDPPLVHVFESDARPVGTAQPATEAPQPRPGPVWSITIPRLNLKTGVVQVDWEPPLFVAGQIHTTAHVTEGNSVLVGHVRGAAGYNVFDHLDQLALGDVIEASSRGMTYQFVVDQTAVLPEDDTSATDPTSTPRLTLMTCAGDWNPITRDYSDRLWVVAEPPELAAATIAAHAAATPVSEAAPTPTGRVQVAQVAPGGGLGNTDTDLATAFGPPGGESTDKLAVYPRQNQGLERRAQLVEVPSSPSHRAVLVAAIPPAGSPLTFDDAVHLSRTLLPKDAQPRAAAPEGNPRFAVERFTSPGLASLFPPDWFTQRQAQPGDFLVVYARRPDGRVTYVALAIGDDANALMAALNDVQGASR